MTDNKNSSPVSVLQNIFFKLYFKIFFFSSFCYFEKSFVFFGYNKTALFLIWPFRKHFIFSSLFFTVKEILTRSNKPDQTAACQCALHTKKKKKKLVRVQNPPNLFFFFLLDNFPTSGHDWLHRSAEWYESRQNVSFSSYLHTLWTFFCVFPYKCNNTSTLEERLFQSNSPI